MASVYRNDRGVFGQEFDPAYCKASVHDSGRGCSFHQCQRRPKTPEGWCNQHHPDAEAKRAKASEDKYNRDMRNLKAARIAQYLGSATLEQLQDEIKRRKK